MAASSSTAKQTPLPIKQAPPLQYRPYPPPLAKYEDVVANPRLFMDTLGKLHAAMGTKFMIPVIGGRDLDLHRAFVEVTSRGGIERVLREKKWKEVTAVFSFPSSATNASFILRKYYYSLLHHYEQIYYFKAKGWTPLSADALHNASIAQASGHGLDQQARPSPEIQATQVKRENICRADSMPGATSAPPTGSMVMGVIDGKFDSGYLITVTIGSEKLKGVLYQSPRDPTSQIPHHLRVAQYQSVMSNVSGSTTAAAPLVHRRRRRKKCEMKKRDPAHPKPNRSGYNFFFAEQHARLKPLHPGKDRDISRMIGELWNKLKENEKAVYQEKAMKDKERYRTEMEDYRERLRLGQIISNAVPIQQRSPVNITEPGEKIEAEVGYYPHSPENDLSSGKSDQSNFDDDKGSDTEVAHGVEFEAENVGPRTLVDEESFELQKRVMTMTEESPLKKQKVGDDREECAGDSVEVGSGKVEGELTRVEGRERVNGEEREECTSGREKIGDEGARLERESIAMEVRELVDGKVKESMGSEDH
ncbi:hypothetical protein LguiB_026258 [Lonicera macranthoides]